MALAALIGAYETSDDGGLRALVPLAGRPLLDFQVRCAVAVGAAPVVVLADDPPEGLLALVDRMRGEGLPVVLASGPQEAAARFEAEHALLLIADGIAPDMSGLAAICEAEGAAILTVPDDEAHERFERIDLEHRWAGSARLTGRDVGATAAMLGDWDLVSTLLRRGVQAGAALVEGEGEGPLLVESANDAALFSQRMFAASRAERADWVARWPMAPLEDWLTGQLSAARVRPAVLAAVTPVLTAAAAAAFAAGQGVVGGLLLLLSLPFDLVGRRIATLRLRPIVPGKAGERATWPLFLLAMLVLGWTAMREGAGDVAVVLAIALAGFAQLGRVIRTLRPNSPLDIATFRRRPAILLLLPFALAGWWTAGLALLASYALVSALWLAHAPEKLTRP